MLYVDLNKAVDVYSGLLPTVARCRLAQPRVCFGPAQSKRVEGASFPGWRWPKSLLTDPDAPSDPRLSSPTGTLPMAGLIASLAWPAYKSAQQRTLSVDVETHLKQIMLGFELYAADFDRYPAQLSDLVPNYISEQDWKTIFESPFNRGALNVPTDIDNKDLTNLVYVANHSLYDLGRDIIVYEKEPTRLAGTDSAKLLYHGLTVSTGRSKACRRPALDRALAGKSQVVDTNGARGGAFPAVNERVLS